jgi:hypothetical protein
MRLQAARSGWGGLPRWFISLGVAAVLGLFPSARLAGAQTDYYNTSVGRPLRIEDASPVEYRAIEFDVAPLRFESARGGQRRWSVHPETAVGMLPRTQLQVGLPIAYLDANGTSSGGVAGLEIALLHALNAETSIPALAVAADVLLPAGPLAADATYGTLKGILTRTTPWARFHANAQFTVGPSQPATGTTTGTDVPSSVQSSDVSRWLAGVAVDKTFPLHSLLVSIESFAEQPIDSAESVAWNAGAGLRYQLAPRWAIDGGIGRRLTGDDRAWYVTFGSAFALGLR